MTRPNDPRDAELSALYRDQQARQEPSAELDARILAAAQAQLQAPARRKPWWRALLVPASVAATALLAVALTLTVEREQHRPQDAAPAAAPAPTSPPEPKGSPEPAREREPKAEFAPAPAAPAAPARPARDATLSRERPAAAKPAPAADAATELRAPVESQTAPEPAHRQQAPQPFEAEQSGAGRRTGVAPASGTTEEALDRRAADPIGRPGERGKARLESAAPASRDAVPLPGSAGVREPQGWIEEIRDLKRAGRLAEARAAIDAFRRAHPDFALPEDLR